MRLPSKINDSLKKKWMRFALRGVAYGDNFSRLNMIYLVADPWRLDSGSERFRYDETNRIITENLGRIGTLLEIGCGEGHQSFYLSQVCKHLTGIDVSSRAVERAQKKCPHSDFIVGDLFSEAAGVNAPFDLVVACKVLYYMKDISASLRRLQTLGNHCLVSYFAREAKYLDPLVLSMPGAKLENIEIRDAKWRIAWWPGRLN